MNLQKKTTNRTGRWLVILALVLVAGLLLATAGRALAQEEQPVDGFENLAGLNLRYQTEIDVGGLDYGHKSAVDRNGNAFVLARSTSEPEENWLVKLDPAGNVLFQVTFGGNALDVAWDLTLDRHGDAIVVGYTLSDNIATPGAYQTVMNGNSDAYITKLDGSDGAILFTTYLGGNRSEIAYAVATDRVGRIYVTGSTDSADFPIRRAFQNELNLNICFCDDAFLAVLNPAGTQLLLGSYWGGEKDDSGRGIGLDNAGNIYIVGETESTEFPLLNELQNQYRGEGDLFAAGFSLQEAVYSTYLGGSDRDWVRGAAVDPAGNLYFAGSTRSPDYPTTAGVVQPTFAGEINGCGSPPFIPLHNCDDAFVSKLAPDGSALVYSTYLGGTTEEFATELALDRAGRVYIIGHTNSTDFLGGSDTAFNIFLVRLNADASLVNGPLLISSAVYNAGHGLALDRLGRNIYLAAGMHAPSDTYAARITLSSPN